MPKEDRNSLIDGDWFLDKLDEARDRAFVDGFDCGKGDLNEYFKRDALLSRNQLIGQVYCLINMATGDDIPVALVDFSNDVVRRSSSNRTPGYGDIPDLDLADSKRYPSLPAVKITRLGVCKDLQGNDIGTQLINMVKKLFVTENRTGCRFLTVDAYNNPNVIRFYEKNDFQLFYDKDKNKKQRAMYFDLKRLVLD